MNDSEFTKLLTRTAKVALNHKLLISKVNNESIARYGVSYSEVDADGIIDILDVQGADGFTTKEFNAEMKTVLALSQNNGLDWIQPLK